MQLGMKLLCLSFHRSDGGNRIGGTAGSSPQGAQPLVGRGFHRYLGHLNTQCHGDVFLHVSDERGDLGLLQNDRRINIDNLEFFPGQEISDRDKEAQTGYIFKLPVRIRKMPANISQGRGAQKGIADSMK